MGKKIVTLEEQKQIRLEILAEADKFCRENGIRYSLAFGTLLGAIRHKGFIPWDDDLDIMMPLPDMLKFKKGFKSTKVKYCDIDTDSNYRCEFGNIGHNDTFRKNGLVSTFFGVGVDVQPFVGLPDSEKDQNKFFDEATKLRDKAMSFIKWQLRLLKILPINNIPGYRNAISEYRNYLYDESVPYSNAKKYYVVALPLEKRGKCIFAIDLFEEIQDVEFEGYKFCCIKNYDYFLKQLYGNYMKLPPIEERVGHHGQKYYWR